MYDVACRFRHEVQILTVTGVEVSCSSEEDTALLLQSRDVVTHSVKRRHYSVPCRDHRREHSARDTHACTLREPVSAKALLVGCSGLEIQHSVSRTGNVIPVLRPPWQVRRELGLWLCSSAVSCSGVGVRSWRCDGFMGAARAMIDDAARRHLALCWHCHPAQCGNAGWRQPNEGNLFVLLDPNLDNDWGRSIVVNMIFAIAVGFRVSGQAISKRPGRRVCRA
jgi:hypothetical protein